jgi:hypothetical protein
MLFDGPWTLEELLASANVPPSVYNVDEIQQGLIELAIEFHLDCRDRRSPQTVIRALAHARKHARQVVAELKSENGVVERMLELYVDAQRVDSPRNEKGSEMVRRATTTVRELQCWIDGVLGAELQKRVVGTRADIAAQDLISGLGRLWKDHWGREPGASLIKLKAGKKQFDGPFIRFVQTYLRQLRVDFDADHLNADPRIRKALEMTPQQIRERIREPRRRLRRMGKSVTNN